MIRTPKVLRALLLFVLVLSLSACGPSTTGPASSKPPPAPKNVELSITPQGLHIRWDPVRGADFYTVFWGNEHDDYKHLMNFTDTPAILAGLTKGRLYSVAVTCWNPNGESEFSSGRLIVYDDDPRHASNYVTKGNELLGKGSLVEAQSYLSAAITLDPYNVQAYRSRALLFEKMNRRDLAKLDYAAATRILKARPLTRMGAALSQGKATGRD